MLFIYTIEEPLKRTNSEANGSIVGISVNKFKNIGPTTLINRSSWLDTWLSDDALFRDFLYDAGQYTIKMKERMIIIVLCVVFPFLRFSLSDNSQELTAIQHWKYILVPVAIFSWIYSQIETRQVINWGCSSMSSTRRRVCLKIYGNKVKQIL